MPDARVDFGSLPSVKAKPAPKAAVQSTRAQHILLGLGAVGGWVIAAIVISSIKAREHGDDNAPQPVQPSASGSPPRKVSPSGGTLTVDTKKTWQGRPMPAQLRAAPGMDGRRTIVVDNGTTVNVIGSQEVGTARTVWYHVQTPDGTEGWMHSEVLK